jgi:hypothetical protein
MSLLEVATPLSRSSFDGPEMLRLGVGVKVVEGSDLDSALARVRAPPGPDRLWHGHR